MKNNSHPSCVPKRGFRESQYTHKLQVILLSPNECINNSSILLKFCFCFDLSDIFWKMSKFLIFSGFLISFKKELEFTASNWSTIVDIRESKSCNHAIAQLHKIFENLRKFWTNERKTGKTGTNFMYLSQFDKVFCCLVAHVLSNFIKLSIRAFWLRKRICF